jgi:hypothetical protein
VVLLISPFGVATGIGMSTGAQVEYDFLN